MDVGYGRLQQHGLPGAIAELPPLSDLLFLDAMWEEEEDGTAVAPPHSGVAGAPARAGGGGGGGGGYAPAGARECAPAGSGLDDDSGSAHGSGADGNNAAGAAASGHVRVCSHPLWPILVDYYFACRRVRCDYACRAGAARRARHAAALAVVQRGAR
jgi:hypothetical protein